mgnify:CR=1 FL=1
MEITYHLLKESNQEDWNKLSVVAIWTPHQDLKRVHKEEDLQERQGMDLHFKDKQVDHIDQQDQLAVMDLEQWMEQ